MKEFWEKAFIEKNEMWGMKPAEATLLAKDLFIEEKVKNILIPGIGYGRNANLFVENGLKVTGIEISAKAIELAKKHFGNAISIYKGSVTQMPFDDEKYNGIFCHALIHLLDEVERMQLIKNCYNQLAKNGYMVFTAITKEATNFRKGKKISKDRYEYYKGAKIFYYDVASVRAEFKKYGLLEIIKVKENQPMYLIKCKKE